MQKPIAVVALGGNALIEKGEDELSQQEIRAHTAMKSIVQLHEKYNLVITHGNGPQVGNLLVRSELTKGKAYSVPLDYCVAQSQGEIGYLLSVALKEVFAEAKKKVSVITVLTRTEVSPNDLAFTKPTKPIGDFYPVEKTSEWKARGIPFISDSGRGYRRVVPSPHPLNICEGEAIAALSKAGHVVIAVGGGGIPIIASNKGVEAVIDKDLATAVLAYTIKAHILIILTAVDAAYLNYLSPRKQKISTLSVKEAKKYLVAGQFSAGSMGPKIEAAITFLQKGGKKGKKVIITDSDHLNDALEDKAGTIMR